ncbi:Hypothetical predicted protein [Lecanosticta acicola]|uniref:Uncharacterized protein n=1 Tax=Lecanosticta acicola TaxID=111012 RepID=A0AAI8W1B4_9PEZI|nr:Hypothetical predicted protein [Lecanosticta acicola]
MPACMLPLLLTTTTTTTFAFLLSTVTAQAPFIGGKSGSHTDLNRWCGKPYDAGSPNFDPGGRLGPPPSSKQPLLDLQLHTRHTIYDSGEHMGEFIVNAALSPFHGQPLGSHWSSLHDSSHELDFQITIDGFRSALVSNKALLNTTRNVFSFGLRDLEPRLEPYNVSLTARSGGAPEQESWEVTTDLYYLPKKNSGSTVKIDNLDGGLLVSNNATGYTFQPLLPFGFYTKCDTYLEYSLANVSAYKDYGFNALNPVCAFTDGHLGYLYDWMDSLDLWYQYDMRGSYTNLTSVAEQIPLVKDRSNLLTWYTADEPDGWEYALNSTRLAYDLLRKQDPYHPTALVLNCQNYYFENYAAGADIIMEDAYPVGIDPTFSRKFNTTVNETYGDAGCDNCIGSLRDVSDRLDDFVEYQTWLGGVAKPLWAVLQAFSGEHYWSRDPTPEETWVMMVLGFNHKAKAMMSWCFPWTTRLESAHGEMAKVASSKEVSRFLLGGDPVAIASNSSLDIAYWSVANQILVSVAHVENSTITDAVSIDLPPNVTRIRSQPWGSLSWSLERDGKLCTYGLDGLATSMLILDR